MCESFSPDDLRLLDEIEEIEVEIEQEQPHRRTIWVVVVGADAYVRSVKGTLGHWYQELVAKSACSVFADERRIPVQAVSVSDAETQAKVSKAYVRKYGMYPHDVSWLVGPKVLPTTLRLEPIYRRAAAYSAAAVLGLAPEGGTQLRGVLSTDACSGGARAIGFYGHARARSGHRRYSSTPTRCPRA
jgi:hypothetical protein